MIIKNFAKHHFYLLFTVLNLEYNCNCILLIFAIILTTYLPNSKNYFSSIA